MINDSIIKYVLQISASSNQFHKYYQYGEFQDCEAYQQDLKNCFLWKTRKSMDAMVLWFLLILCIRTPHSLSLSLSGVVKGAVAPGVTLFGGWHFRLGRYFGIQIPHEGLKSAVRMQEMQFQIPKF